ncbi:S-layer domain protein [Moorena producens 3L]|uniref:S-layer domain protein n=1 Tax=Moorena producens 3L TaxID=489825 RepID=F4XM35_9CYAN|nr:S-layer domain protein [Moorena producens 3L]
MGKGRGEFVDSSAKFWASQAIRKAAVMGFISGFPDRTFRPQQNLTRVQGLVSLVKGLGLTGGESSELGFYRDRTQIPSYATQAVATATQRRMVVNYPQPNQLNPMRPINRAEVAALIYQALVATGSADAIGRRPRGARSHLLILLTLTLTLPPLAIYLDTGQKILFAASVV